MPARLPFFAASTSLQEKLAEASSPQRVKAQVLVFVLIVSMGVIRHYLFPLSRSRSRSTTACQLDHLPGESKASRGEEETIAQVDSILLYPIKSCAAVRLNQARLVSSGLELDRRWMVVTRHKRRVDGRYTETEDGKWMKVSLREDPRLTLVLPTLDEEHNLLRLSISEHAGEGYHNFGSIATPLRPTRSEMEGWEALPNVEMWGDYADSRIVPCATTSSTTASSSTTSPSEWLSTFLGYPVLLILFDHHSTVQRAAYPIFKPPTDVESWNADAKAELVRPRGIAFSDEYPLLVSTVESVRAVEEQIRDAARASRSDGPGGGGGDGRGGKAIGGFDATMWKEGRRLDVVRFRPNIVLSSLVREGEGEGGGSEQRYPPFSEDSWDHLTFLPSSSSSTSPASPIKTKATMAMVARCKRCLLTAVEPTTGERDASVPLKFLLRSRMREYKTSNPMGSQLGKIEPGQKGRGPCFGVYAVPLPLSLPLIDGSGGREGEREEGYGEIQIGDPVRVRWRPAELDDEER